ncbi:hypothetical protein NLJ89_g8372 [Agrocybe chaxingu]|uniref:Uncharacterized protein n=1 Tax=Agrocybe chaxingu TaxID=84603 RepID=A0A9W8JVD8_9AGAR|nr:hypothetical protein NLJ89_g8372 [Agrocybe chaxingu]
MSSAKSKKARIVAPTSRTLHEFFTAKAISSIPSKPQAKSSSKTAKSSPCSRNLSQQEIIVIDSESDDEPEVLDTQIPLKRRKLSLKNADNCFDGKLGQSSKLRPLERVANPSAAKENSGPGSYEGGSLHVFKEEDVASFGEPILLRSADANITIAHNTPASTFGKPLLLISAFHGAKSETKALLSRTPVVKKDVTVDIDLTLDDWENGDDEVTYESLKQEDEEGMEAACLWSAIEEGSSGNSDNVANLRDSVEHDWDMEIHDDNQIPETLGGLESVKRFPGPPLTDTSDQTSCDVKTKISGSNAFSFLMSSFKENEEWKEASLADDKSFRPVKANGGRRKAPFYKVLQGMPIAVDAFRYGAIPGVTAYFLTHAHSDHYTNLSSNWKNGPIYCSEGTANLIVHILSVDRKWVHRLPMDTPMLIPNTNGVTVTLIEANHCPGSCLFFFEGPQTVNAGDSAFKSSFVGSSKTFRYLHCGDFRASPRHIMHPAVRGKTIDLVYLDTTYLDPKYTFPPQPLVISACAELVKKITSGQASDKASSMLSWVTSSKGKGKQKETPKLLVVVGTYSIGKERIVKAIAHALNSKVYCDTKKTAILRCQADPELDALLTANPLQATVHLVIGFRPTGWTYTSATGSDHFPSIPAIISKSSQQKFSWADLKLSAKSTASLQLYPVPYSEHSSFFELTCFAMSFSWVKMIATVNVGSESSRGKMAKWVAKWESERRKRGKDTIVPHRHPDYW